MNTVGKIIRTEYDWTNLRMHFSESERLNMLYPIDANIQLCEFAFRSMCRILRDADLPVERATVFETEQLQVLETLDDYSKKEIEEMLLSLPIEQFYQFIMYCGKHKSILFSYLMSITTCQQDLAG